MVLSPNLFDALDPPEVWVHLAPCESGEHSERKVSLRIKGQGQRSVNVSQKISRYSPEASVFRAVQSAVEELATLQCPVKRSHVEDAFARAVLRFVDPF